MARTKYTPGLGELVCDVFETAHGSLQAAFDAREDLPTLQTVYNWELDHPEFFERLSRARAIRAHVMADGALDVADESDRDTITKTGRDGEPYEAPNTEWMARSRLRFEARRWAAKTLNQSVYGDKQAVNLGGQPDNPLRTESTVLEIQPADYAPEERDMVLRIAHKRLQGAS